MPIVTNAYTGQKPMSGSGVTGTQSIRFIPAPRVFIKTTPDSTTAAVVPNTKGNGSLSLAGWTDLGIVLGNAKVTYDKKLKEIRTGLDNYLRAAYAEEKGGVIEFSLAQVDDVAMEKISGLTASVVTTGSVYTFHLGQEDVTQVALLLVCQNKLDGKELQFYSPLVYMSFNLEEDSDALVMRCTAMLPYFTVSGQSNEEVLAMTLFR